MYSNLIRPSQFYFVKDSLWNLTLINFFFMNAIDSFWSTIVLHCISCVITNHLDLKYIGILELFEDLTFLCTVLTIMVLFW